MTDIHRHIFDQVPDAIIFADTEGKIRLWNHGAEALFGHTAGEAIGQSLDIIIPEHLRKAHWAGFNEAIRSGKTKHAGEVRTTRSMRKNGERLYVAITFAVIRDESGKTLGSAAVGRDITKEHLEKKTKSS